MAIQFGVVNNFSLVITGLIVVLMTFLRPSKENAVKDLALHYDEITLLEDPGTIISEFEKSED